jgi:hypothetical protein
MRRGYCETGLVTIAKEANHLVGVSHVSARQRTPWMYSAIPDSWLVIPGGKTHLAWAPYPSQG